MEFMSRLRTAFSLRTMPAVMSGSGTSETCRRLVNKSPFEGRSGVAGGRPNRRRRKNYRAGRKVVDTTARVDSQRALPRRIDVDVERIFRLILSLFVNRLTRPQDRLSANLRYGPRPSCLGGDDASPT